MNPYRNFYFGVDFDDTCIIRGKKYPEIKEDMPGAVAALKTLVHAGVKILLITSREGEELDAAVAWFALSEIPLAGVNENPDEFWKGHRKIFCDCGVDDRDIGVPMMLDLDGGRGQIIDWRTVTHRVLMRHVTYLMERMQAEWNLSKPS